MKSVLASFAVFAALVASADTTCTNIIGVLAIPSSAAETIVSVPWVGASVSNSAPIKVADIVKTANLNVGDELYVYDTANTKYLCWHLVAGDDGQPAHWEPATVVSSEGVTKEAGEADATLKRGDAFLLKRQGTIADCFYLQGQYTSAAAGEQTLGQGGQNAAAYSLIAPPAVEETDLNSATWKNVGKKDFIVLASGLLLTYDSKNGGWGKDTVDVSQVPIAYGHDTSVAKIKAGQGAWFVSAAGASEVPSVTWK